MRTCAIAVALLSALLPVAAQAQTLAFGPLVSDGAVLQRGVPVSISGSAEPGATVEVKLGEAVRKVTADAAGKWEAAFPPLDAASGLELAASSGKETLTANGLAAGDVFLCSGQSNMQWAMEDTAMPDHERRMPIDKSISLFSVPIASARTEQQGFAGPSRWSKAFDGSGDFSAVCLLAGRAIARSQGVPVGLIDASMGGTPIEAWLPYDGLQRVGGMDDALAMLDAFRSDPVRAEAEHGARLDAMWTMPPPPGQERDRPRMGYANLFNGMIAPLGSTPLAGVLWYQGENNTRRDNPRAAYKAQLRALLDSWRARFGAEVPFVIVQLASFGRLSSEPGENAWSEVREAQRQVAEEDPLAELVTTVDVGERLDIHPPLKKPVGHRAAVALAFLRYGGPAEALGPRPVSATRADGEVWIAIAAGGEGLMAASWGRPGPFIVCSAGTPGECSFADARLVPGGIAVKVPEGVEPALVRYCWGAAPICNVFDRAQQPLPAFELPVARQP